MTGKLNVPTGKQICANEANKWSLKESQESVTTVATEVLDISETPSAFTA